MPAYNFQSRFAYLVESGLKRSTIRARRADGRDAKPGQTLYLFTGQRTGHCRRLKETRCESVRPIRITRAGFFVAGKRLSIRDASDLAKGDGFSGPGDMLIWFWQNHGLPFSGILIKW